MEIFNGVKKFLFAVSLGAGLLFGASALAAALAPGSVSGGPVMPGSWPAGTSMPAQQAQAGGSAKMVTPCVMTRAGQGSGVYNTAMPCGNNVIYRSLVSPGYGVGRPMVTWFALLFVITLIMVWVILLLLIGILWHMLKKHRRS